MPPPPYAPTIHPMYARGVPWDVIREALPMGNDEGSICRIELKGQRTRHGARLQNNHTSSGSIDQRHR